MKCINCGEEAGRKGNRHVKTRKFTCARMVKRLETKRKWYGAREENWVVVEVPSYDPYDLDLTDWQSSDENRTRYADSRFDDYADRYSSSRYDSYDHETSRYETPAKSSDDYSSRSSSYDSTPSYNPPSTSNDSGSSWSSGSSSSSSNDSGSSYSSGSSGSSYDSGSSSSSDSGGGW